MIELFIEWIWVPAAPHHSTGNTIIHISPVDVHAHFPDFALQLVDFSCVVGMSRYSPHAIETPQTNTALGILTPVRFSPIYAH